MNLILIVGTAIMLVSTTLVPEVVVPLAFSQENLADGNTNNNNNISSTSPIEKFEIEDQTFPIPSPQPSGAIITNITNATTTIHWPNIHSNVLTDFDPNVFLPEIEESAFIHPFAIVIGDCHIGRLVLVAPTAVCRGDEGTPINVGDFSNIQDGVLLHALETTSQGKNLDQRRFSIDGDKLSANDPRFANGYAIFVGNRTSLAHDSLIHGPAWVGNNTFVGMKSIVFNAKVGNNVSVGVSSTITGGVTIPDNRYVPPGSVIVTQEQADQLPIRVGSPLENINDAVIHVNEALAEGYGKEDIEILLRERESDMENGMLETSMP